MTPNSPAEFQQDEYYTPAAKWEADEYAATLTTTLSYTALETLRYELCKDWPTPKDTYSAATKLSQISPLQGASNGWGNRLPEELPFARPFDVHENGIMVIWSLARMKRDEARERQIKELLTPEREALFIKELYERGPEDAIFRGIPDTGFELVTHANIKKLLWPKARKLLKGDKTIARPA